MLKIYLLIANILDNLRSSTDSIYMEMQRREPNHQICSSSTGEQCSNITGQICTHPREHDEPPVYNGVVGHYNNIPGLQSSTILFNTQRTGAGHFNLTQGGKSSTEEPSEYLEMGRVFHKH